MSPKVELRWKITVNSLLVSTDCERLHGLFASYLSFTLSDYASEALLLDKLLNQGIWLTGDSGLAFLLISLLVFTGPTPSEQGVPP